MRGAVAWICVACLTTVLPVVAGVAHGAELVDLTPHRDEAHQVNTIIGLIRSLDDAMALADTVAAKLPKRRSDVRHEVGIRSHKMVVHKSQQIKLPGGEMAKMCADLSGHASVRRPGRTTMDFVYRKDRLSAVAVSAPWGGSATFELPGGDSHGKSEGSLTGVFHPSARSRKSQPGDFTGTSSFDLGKGALTEGQRGNAETDGPAHVDKSIPKQVWEGSRGLKAQPLRTFVRTARKRASGGSSKHLMGRGRQAKGS